MTDIYIIAPKPRQQQVIGLQPASDATRSRLSTVTKATVNDVCVRRFVKFARQKSFSG